MNNRIANKKSELRPLIYGIFIVMAINCVFNSASISGPSMENTFRDGDLLMRQTLFYSLSRGDIVDIDIGQYGLGEDSDIVKRIIGMSEDTIEAKDGIVHLNGERLSEPYVKGITDDFDAITVPVGHVFIMGDNREDSIDSRDIGPVRMDDILAKFIFSVEPLSKIY